MTDRVHARLLILAVLVMSLVGTLAARAFSLQVVDADEARAAAEDNRVRELVIPAARGMVLDQQGRPLASNRISLDVSVDRRELRRLDDDGASVLDRLADLLDVDADVLAARLQNCGTPGAQKQPNCWNGAPGADPVVARDVGIEAAGQVMADPTGFPAVAIDRVPVRQYPGQSLAAHAVGHVGAVTAEDLVDHPELEGSPARGQAGLELVHDAALRGQAGLERVTVDSAGHRASAGVEVPAVPGRTLVTNLDAELQAVVEEQLQAAITRARGRIDPISEQPYKADGGAAVVLDVRTGAVLALASAPDFDANIWTGGIAADDYAALTDPAAGQPLLNRAVQTALAPASTFKVVSAAAALDAGYSTTAAYDCPSSYSVGGRAFQNYRSRSLGPLTLGRALELSCDTVFYRLAHEQWRADGGSRPVDDPKDLIASTAADFGFGTPTGIDLPGETAGRLASREAKAAQWDQLHDEWCARAKGGYPEVADAERSRYLTRLAKENCKEGMLWRVGDALNASIGQGRHRGDRPAGGHRLRRDRQWGHGVPAAGRPGAAERRRDRWSQAVQPERAGTVGDPRRGPGDSCAGASRGRRHRHRPAPLRGLPARPGPDRGQDRDRRGVRQPSRPRGSHPSRRPTTRGTPWRRGINQGGTARFASAAPVVRGIYEKLFGVRDAHGRPVQVGPARRQGAQGAAGGAPGRHGAPTRRPRRRRTGGPVSYAVPRLHRLPLRGSARSRAFDRDSVLWELDLVLMGAVLAVSDHRR